LRLLQDRNDNGAADAVEDVRVVQLPEKIGFARGSAPQLGTGSAAVTYRINDGAPTLISIGTGAPASPAPVIAPDSAEDLRPSRLPHR
jgi:hypothetical protein